MRVLIGEISSYKAIVIARHLKQQYPTVEIVGYDYKPFLRHIHTRYIDNYVAIPHNDGVHYVDNLAQCVHSIHPDVLIPVHSDFIGDILANKHKFGTTLDYLGAYEDYIQLHEKNRLMQLAATCGVRIPINYASPTVAVLPFVAKPNDKSSAKGVFYCFTEDDRAKLLHIASNYVYQEYILGTGCGYEVYCRDGKILKEYGHIRLAEFPTSGGSSVWRKGYIHPDMRPMAETILSKVHWTGFAMFEFKVTPANELVLIEVNPRIWGSINQALQDGVLFFDDIVGSGKIAPIPWKGVHTCLSPQVYLSLLGYAIRGKETILREYIQHRKHILSDVSIVCDCKGFLSMIIRKLL